VDEYVLPTTIAGDEAEALVDIEPFHGAGLFDRCAGRWPAGGRRPETRSRWCRRRRGARIDAQHLGDVRPFVAGADTNLERFSWTHGGDPALSQHASVKEGITGPIRKFDEPEAFVRVEPLDDAVDWRTRRCLERLAKLGSGAESAGLSLVVVIVAEIEASGGAAIGIKVDVRDQEAVGAMVARVVQEWGGVDVLVANEGGGGATRHLTVRSRSPLRPRAAANIADRVGAAGPCSQRANAAR